MSGELAIQDRGRLTRTMNERQARELAPLLDQPETRNRTAALGSHSRGNAEGGRGGNHA